ncbi:prolipoprotein diacylglyceryl transferase [Streptococcus moroccensis]|uniref:Phosphatidylglycerol--prolipoprotein diacylglyceryl transferase n=1 Tax=Streptococcus moroccensis TaxID=1451356 RepID=A0ABT9YRA9_9STRE|nr:prolipoprotein diacylglyceryl transferase [Streptococcus moroccensis]MDQ0222534.1 phosphatidylglycerol:prolipoprotein diacylglycerol transferase [Streptococcus moroccensis]
MIDPIAIELGPIQIRWYALCIVAGLLLGVYLAMKEAPRKKIDPDQVVDFILLAFPIAIIGARIYYVAFSWDQYKDNLAEIFAIWHGGIAIYGGLIAGAIVLYFFSRYHFIEPLDLLDIAVPGVMVAQSIGRWGNFFNQEAYGKAVESLNYLPSFIREQMYIDGSYRQPTFLYESLWNLVGFLVLMSIRHQGWMKRGEPTAFYLIWYGIGRMVIEGMRTDSLMVAGLRVSQWLSVVIIAMGLVLIAVIRKNKNQPLY